MSLLGPTIVVKGEVNADSDLRVDGRVEGPIWGEGHAITLTETAVVSGDVVGRDITVSGVVDGTLLAADVVDIRKTAQVNGRVVAGRLILADGCLFNGSVEPQQVEAAMHVARHRRHEASQATGVVEPKAKAG